MKIPAAFALLISLSIHAQDNTKACQVFNRISTVMEQKHYKPKPVNDSLSAYVFNTVIDQLDENHVLLIDEEFNRLVAHKLKIDDYLKSNDCSFFTDFISTYRSALERNKKFIQEISAEELTYNTTDTIHYSKKSFPFLKDPQRIKKYLRKKITYDILEDISELSTNKDSLAGVLPKLFAAGKTKVIDSHLCRVDNLLTPPEGFEDSMYSRFYSVFCSYFDPHSTYLSYNDRASFVSTISTQNYSLGLYVSQNQNEEIVVEEVVPGGPAFRTNKVEKGDKIIKMGANNTEYTVSCAAMDAINNIVSSDTYKEIDITLRKQDGTMYTVTLTKEIMKDDDNLVYSYILGEGKQKTGYIKIPSFYGGFDNEGQSGCAEDVAKEVTTLMKSGISGLIIDLQFNGGGSMDEVIRMAGMFINFGPISVLTDKQMQYNTIRDYNRGMLYNGPMVVLVNGLSASASEFFAGVMQDYNRAVIVGSPTLGKATMQTIMPLQENDEANFIKVTVDRFYRVSGQSSQYTGIIPDVQLPMLFSEIMPRESSMPNAMKNDSIPVRLRYSKMPDDAIKKAVQLSKQRTAGNALLKEIGTLNSRINTVYKASKPALPVTFSTVYDQVHSTDGIYKEVSAIADKENAVTVTGSFNAAGSDDYIKTVNDFKIKNIKTDPYIFEGLNILNDLSHYKKH